VLAGIALGGLRGLWNLGRGTAMFGARTGYRAAPGVARTALGMLRLGGRVGGLGMGLGEFAVRNPKSALRGAIGLMALGGVGFGAYGAMRDRRRTTWVEYTPDGTPEVRRPYDLGATGSLGLAAYKRARGGGP